MTHHQTLSRAIEIAIPRLRHVTRETAMGEAARGRLRAAACAQIRAGRDTDPVPHSDILLAHGHAAIARGEVVTRERLEAWAAQIPEALQTTSVVRGVGQ